MFLNNALMISPLQSPGQLSEGKPSREQHPQICDSCINSSFKGKSKAQLGCSHCYFGQKTYAYGNSDIDPTGQPENLLVDAIRLLNSRPTNEALHALGELRGYNSSQYIMKFLRSGMGEAGLSSGTSMCNLNDLSFVTNELEVKHPLVYPSIPTWDAQSSSFPMNQLVKSGGKMPFQRPRLQDIPSEYTNCLWKESILLSWSCLYDPRLLQCHISHWTSVPIPNDLACRVLSLYFHVDHPLIGTFYAEYFIRDFVSGRTNHCSSLLVKALMYYACQMYSGVEIKARSFVEAFRLEANKTWCTQEPLVPRLRVAAAMFLSLGNLAQGRKDEVKGCLYDMIYRSTNMGWYDSGHHVDEEEHTIEDCTADAYTAWATFNWIIMMAVFYFPTLFAVPYLAPRFLIPRNQSAPSRSNTAEPGSKFGNPTRISETFTMICQFWRIMHGVLGARKLGPDSMKGNIRTPEYAEYKFRELLAWADNLPAAMIRDKQMPNHTIVLHMWLHMAIMNILQPFLNITDFCTYFRTFPTPEASPHQAYEASVKQLKLLITTYRMNYDASVYSFPWHMALTYLANGMICGFGGGNASFYFRVCLHGYKSLCVCYPIAEPIIKALVSVGVRHRYIPLCQARRLLDQLVTPAFEWRETSGTFVSDLTTAVRDPEAASVESLIQSFDNSVLMSESTKTAENHDNGVRRTGPVYDPSQDVSGDVGSQADEDAWVAFAMFTPMSY